MGSQKGREGMAVLMRHVGTRWRWVVNAQPWPLHTQESAPFPITEDAKWSLGLV